MLVSHCEAANTRGGRCIFKSKYIVWSDDDVIPGPHRVLEQRVCFAEALFTSASRVSSAYHAQLDASNRDSKSSLFLFMLHTQFPVKTDLKQEPWTVIQTPGSV